MTTGTTPQLSPHTLMPDVRMHRWLSWRALLGSLALFSLVWVASYISAVQLYDQERLNARQQLNRYMQGLASAIAPLINAEQHQHFTKREQMKDPAYQALQQQLESVLQDNRDIRYLYTFIIKDDVLYYIFDAASPDEASPPPTDEPALMRPEKEEPGLMREAVLGQKPLVEPYPTPTEWGPLASAYAPIIDQHGNFVAMLGLDIAASDYYAITSRMDKALFQALAIAAAYAFIISILAYIGVLTYRNIRIQAAKRIADSESHLQRIIQNVPGIVFRFCMSPRGSFSFPFISDRVAELGMSPDDFRKDAERVFDFIHPDDRARILLSIHQSAAKMKPWKEEFRLQVNGQLVWMEGRSVPVADPKRNIIWDGVLMDITDRKLAESELSQSEEQLELMARALGSTPNGIVITDAKGDDHPLIYVNPAFTEITGYEPHEVISRNCRFLQQGDTKQAGLYVLREALRNGASCRVLLRNYRKDGMLFWNDLQLSPIHNQHGTLTHYVGLLNNVTELKNAQEMLQLTNTELHQKNLALEEARKGAEQANLIKRDFLANMSHEIRTPMHGILGTVDLLHSTKLDATQRKYVDILHRTGESMLVIINDILDFSKIEAGNLELRPTAFNPGQAVGNVVDLFMATAKEKHIQLTSSISKKLPSHILGDHDRVRQILSNFVSNAIKFTSEGSVRIKVSAKTPHDNRALIRYEVIDSGMGIPPKYQDYIFNKFTQADTSMNRKYGGTGLGLAICKQLAELMGGNVGVTSEEGKGSTFWFEAPFEIISPATQAPKTPHQHVDGASEPDPSLLAGKKVLLAEDNPTNLMIAEATFKRFGMEITAATDGALAVERFRDHSFDIIIMDIQMPNMNGFEATQAIRDIEAKENRSRTPIVAFTANVLEGYREECIKAGMDDYLTKPLQADRMQDVLLRLLATEHHRSETSSALAAQTQSHIPAPPMPQEGHIARLEAQEILHLDTTPLEHLQPILGNAMFDLLEQFNHDTMAQIANLRIATSQQNSQRIREISHTLKSSALNVGGKILSELFRTLELNPDITSDQLAVIMNEIEQEFRHLQKLLKQYEKQLQQL